MTGVRGETTFRYPATKLEWICGLCNTRYFDGQEHQCRGGPSPLAEFDAALAGITERRGATYGHPADDFGRAAAMKMALPSWHDARFRHIAEMLVLKLARLAATPTHVDSLVDIAGYARTWAMILERDYGQVAGAKTPGGSPRRGTTGTGGVFSPRSEQDRTTSGLGGGPTPPGSSQSNARDEFYNRNDF